MNPTNTFKIGSYDLTKNVFFLLSKTILEFAELKTSAPLLMNTSVLKKPSWGLTCITSNFPNY